MRSCDYCDGCASLRFETWVPRPSAAAICESRRKATWLGAHRVLTISTTSPRGLIKIIRPAWCPGKEGDDTNG